MEQYARKAKPYGPFICTGG